MLEAEETFTELRALVRSALEDRYAHRYVSIFGELTFQRCVYKTHEAHASYRVTGTCMATGQAAGMAAAWAAEENVRPRELDGTKLNQRLRERGVGFLQ